MSGVERAGRAAGAALAIALAAASAAGAAALLLHPAGWTPLGVAAGLALAVVAWIRPVLAVAVLLALAPICGNRPATGPYLAFVGLTACAVPGWVARLAGRDRAVAWDLLSTPTGLALAGYVGLSVLSLSSLPLYAPADIVQASTLAEAVRLLPAALAAADVTDAVYPVLTVILTLHALVAAMTIAVAIRREPTSGGPLARIDPTTLVTTAMLAGLAIVLAAAALDRLALIDLRRLRDTDPFTNASGAERLQSTFGHAGWFAEYVCFTTPAILAVWLWPPVRVADGPAWRGWRRRGRVAAAALLLASALVAIVLSYQRGGWITWALLGAAVAASAVWLAARDGTAAPSIPLRRLVPIAAAALVVAIAAGLVVVRVTGGPGAMDRFAARARAITQVSDRQGHVMAGLRLGAMLPVLGGGSESFALRYREEYLLAGGAYYARGYSPLLAMYGSAHNVFAQTFAGKGAAGLAALVFLVMAAAAAAVRTLRRSPPTSRSVPAALIVLGMVAAFTLYGQVQEVFYVAPLQLLVFAAFGIAAALEPPAPPGSRPAARIGVVAAVLTVVLAAHLVHAYVVPGPLAEGYRDRQISLAGARLSAPELGSDGVYLQWTGPRAFVTVPRQATELSFEVSPLAGPPRVIEVRFDDRLVDRLTLDGARWRRVVYPLRRVRTELPRRLQLVVTTLPSGAGAAADRGVAIRQLRWGLP